MRSRRTAESADLAGGAILSGSLSWFDFRFSLLSLRGIDVAHARRDGAFTFTWQEIKRSESNPISVVDYQKARTKYGAQGRTINLEIGLLRSVLKASDLWLPLAGKVRMLYENKDVGRAISPRPRGRVAGRRIRTSLFRLPAVPDHSLGAQHGHAVERNQDAALVTG